MKFLKRKPRPVHKGNMLLQAGIALAIVLILTPAAIDGLANSQQSKVWTGTASHLTFVAQAAKRYVRDNRDKLLTQVAGGPVIISGATLRTQGYLPAAFRSPTTAVRPISWRWRGIRDSPGSWSPSYLPRAAAKSPIRACVR